MFKIINCYCADFSFCLPSDLSNSSEDKCVQTKRHGGDKDLTICLWCEECVCVRMFKI